MAFSLNSEDLLDIEADLVSIKLAMLVVNLDVALSNLIGQENILIENRAHGTRTLIDAAPGFDIAGLRLGLTNYHIDWLLTNDHDLLKFHFVVFVIGLESGFYIVLDLGLWLFSRVLMLELEGGRYVVRQLRLEVNLVDTWLQIAVHDIEHAVFILQEFLLMLELISMVYCSISVLSRVVADETALLSTLDLKLDVRSIHCLHDLDVYHAYHGVSWLIERVLCLNLDSTFWEMATFVLKEEHCIL